MRISDWSSDVCSSDLSAPAAPPPRAAIPHRTLGPLPDPQDGVEDRRRVGGGDDIVRHDAEGALEMAVGPAHRPGLDDVEEAEQAEGEQHGPGIDAGRNQGEPPIGRATCRARVWQYR